MSTIETPPSTAGPVVSADLLCVGCGYNLRTLAEDGRCPECSQLIATSLHAWARVRNLAPGLHRGAAALSVSILLPTIALLAFTGWTLLSAPYWTQLATRGTWPATLNLFLGRALSHANSARSVFGAIAVALWLWVVPAVSGVRGTWLARSTSFVALACAVFIVGCHVYALTALPALGPGPLTPPVLLALIIARVLAGLALVMAWALLVGAMELPAHRRLRWLLRVMTLLFLVRIVAPLALLIAYRPPPSTMVFEIQAPEMWRSIVLRFAAWSQASQSATDLVLLACFVLLIRALRPRRTAGSLPPPPAASGAPLRLEH